MKSSCLPLSPDQVGRGNLWWDRTSSSVSSAGRVVCAIWQRCQITSENGPVARGAGRGTTVAQGRGTSCGLTPVTQDRGVN